MEIRTVKYIISIGAIITFLIVSHITVYNYGRKVGNLEHLEFASCGCENNKQKEVAISNNKGNVSIGSGIDVSHHQGKIDWVRVAEYSPAFVYIKATEGATYTDSHYHSNSKGAIDAGLKTGAYHFFRMTSSVDEQFDNFIKAIDAYPHQLIPMVDVETADGCSKHDLRKKLKQFLDKLEKRYGVAPMIYGTNRSYNELCGTAFDSKYPLYIGRYGSNAPIVKGKSIYTIWQFSETGRVPGIPKPVDLCRFHKEKNVDDIMLK